MSACILQREGGSGGSLLALYVASVSGYLELLYLELHFSLHCQKSRVATYLKGHRQAAWVML